MMTWLAWLRRRVSHSERELDTRRQPLSPLRGR